LLTLSTYTELQPVTTLQESPKLHEVHESEESEHEDFAQILAGLMQKNSDEQAPEETEAVADVLLMDFSGIETSEMVLTVEKSGAVKDPDILSLSQETVNIGEDDLLELDIPEEQADLLLSAEHLMARQEINDSQADEYLQDFANNVEEIKHLAEINTKTNNLSSGTGAEKSASFTQTDEAVVTQQSIAASDEAPANNKKESLKENTLSKKDNIENPSQNKSGEEVASIRKGQENDSRLRPDDPRRGSRRDKLSFEVRDMRTGSTANAANNANDVNIRVNAGLGNFTGRVQDAPLREITLELRLPDYNNSSMGQSSAQTTWQSTAGMDARAGAAVENMLARELHQNFNGDIVRHASVALRDGGEGTIKIALRPESLGNVKIHLEMSENKITGQIFVDSEEALNAFKKEIASLEQAFREAGFSNADLNLSLTDGGRNADLREQEAPSFLSRIAAGRYDASQERETVRTVDVLMGHRPGAINMLA
jgi:flagellar hook-length control protein FliK